MGLALHNIPSRFFSILLRILIFEHFILLSHSLTLLSVAIRQSPRGERDIVPIFIPSGIQLRLNWLKKNVQ
jgi:hypothetical protein